MMREQKAKEYLQTIYALEAEGVVRGAYIAKEMDVSKATVSVAVHTLEDNGFLVMDCDHSIHLTEKGRHLARESIHQTVKAGKNYHALIQQWQDQVTDPMREEELILERSLRWLERERACGILEAHRILSKRYYCVRLVDHAHYLELSSGTVRAKLKRMEKNGFVRLGEDTVVTLTEKGTGAAEKLHEQHEALRAKGLRQGMSEEEAERRAASSYG